MGTLWKKAILYSSTCLFIYLFIQWLFRVPPIYVPSQKLWMGCSCGRHSPCPSWGYMLVIETDVKQLMWRKHIITNGRSFPNEKALWEHIRWRSDIWGFQGRFPGALIFMLRTQRWQRVENQYKGETGFSSQRNMSKGPGAEWWHLTCVKNEKESVKGRERLSLMWEGQFRQGLWVAFIPQAG